MNKHNINELIKRRRSIYPNMYSDEMIDDSIINQMLENANWAPNHKHTAPWRFVVFTGKGLNKLADFQSTLYKNISEKKGAFNEEKYKKLASKPLLASHIISIGMQRDSERRIPEIEEIEAVACAVQNMYLTAAFYGIGCYWGSGGITYEKEAKAFFGLGEEDRLLGFLYAGMPKKWPEGRRLDIKDKIKWIR